MTETLKCIHGIEKMATSLGLADTCGECALYGDVNQCDGCAAGMPLKDGVHQYPEGVWHGMVCTKDRYLSPRQLRDSANGPWEGEE